MDVPVSAPASVVPEGRADARCSPEGARDVRSRPPRVIEDRNASGRRGPGAGGGDASPCRRRPAAGRLHPQHPGRAAPVAGAVFGTGPARRPATRSARRRPERRQRQHRLRGHGPHNETSIAVNPTDPRQPDRRRQRLPAGDQPGRPRQRDPLSRAHVTFDGGQTWTMYPIGANSTYQATGDPAVAFDAAGNAYYATLGFRFVGPANAQNPDILVSVSKDGGVTWDPQPRRRRAAATSAASATCSTRSTSPRGATATRSSRSATSGSARRARFVSRPDLRHRDPRRRRDVDDAASSSPAA